MSPALIFWINFVGLKMRKIITARGLEVQVTAERWTKLDRVLAREPGRAEGVIDLRPGRDGGSDSLRDIRLGRMTAPDSW